MKRNPNRIEFTVGDGFKNRVKLLSSKWNLRTNQAIERAVDLALSRESPTEEKALLASMDRRLHEICQLLNIG